MPVKGHDEKNICAAPLRLVPTEAKMGVRKETHMEKSESIGALAAALAKAQGQAKGALKENSNPFFKSKYADLASVVAAIREAFSSNGLAYTQIMHHTGNQDVAVETVLLHSSGEWMSCGVLVLPVTKADAQGVGSAVTYARRYSLQAAVGIAAEDDDGNAAAHAAPPATDKIADAVAQILDAPDLVTLQPIFAEHYRAAKQSRDRQYEKAVTSAYNQQKAKFTPNQEANNG